MNISTMRIVDRWVGVPVCWFLTMVRRLFGSERPAGSGEVRRILFIKPAEQGATVLAYPAITRAVEMVGRRNVYFLVFEENSHIFEVLDVIPLDNIITIPTRGAISFFWGTLTSLIKVRMLKPDIAVDMEFFARFSAIVTYLTGAKTRVGFHSFSGEAAYRGDLMTHRLGYNSHLHISQVYLAMLEAASLPPSALPALPFRPATTCGSLPLFRPDTGSVNEIRSLLQRETGWEEGTRLVLLNANCSDLLPLRSWPAGRYVQLARRLLKSYNDLLVIFTGPPEERAAIEKLVADVDSGRCVSLAGKTTLRLLLTLYSMVRVMVTNDSGPAHFAALTPMDVVTLFGPETPAIFGSLSPRNRVISAGLACSPCVNAYNDRYSPCSNNLCMQNITVDQVYDEVNVLLQPVKEKKSGTRDLECERT